MFGIFHPNVSSVSRGAILIAPPLLTETIRTQYALKEIAIGLARSGYDVLRFDFSACGDSFGDLRKLRIDDWIDDLRDATVELKDLTGFPTISVFCARLSSGIAAAVSAKNSWDSLVMWDPLLRGRDWLEQIEIVRSLLSNHHLTKPYEYLGEQSCEDFAASVSTFEAPEITGAPNCRSGYRKKELQPSLAGIAAGYSFDSKWRRPFTENLFSHKVVSESIGLFSG